MKSDLVFVHGGPGYLDYLRPYFESRFSKSISTHFYDQLHTDDTNVDALVDQLKTQLTKLGPAIYLAGHSWGGVLVLEYLRRTADPRIKGIVFMDSYLCWAHANEDYQAELKRLGLTNPTTEEVFFTKEERPHVAELVKFLNASFNREMFQRIRDDFFITLDLHSFMQQIKIPVLNIFGANDIRIPASIIREFTKLNQAFALEH